jgi:imidazolonepropionase-like amidohydrolase
LKLLLYCLPWVAACSQQEAPPPATSSAVLFEGARLIIGDESRSVENAAFVVENGRFTQVGTAGEVEPPAGATRVDLTGKTVMPALVDLHVHLGYADIGGMTNSPENYSRDNLIDHLRRSAYYGTAAALSMGIDPGDMPLQLREETIPGAARFLSVGPGIARPNAGPGAADRRDIPYGVTTQQEARAAVRELAAKNVDMVKIWVDDRNGTVEKLTPDLYGAIIDEAHAHGLRVAAHIFNLEDAKDLLRAGLDGFAHGVRDLDIDAEFMALLAERPDLFLIPNLPESGLRSEADLAFFAETLPAEAIERMREELASQEGGDPDERFEVQAHNLARMHVAGVTIGFGTDGDGSGWNAHEELADMVAAGLSPAEVIVAATSTSAEILGLGELGTVAAGKSADFIVLDANPLDDIANTRRIDRVYLRGEEVDRGALRARWVRP